MNEGYVVAYAGCSSVGYGFPEESLRRGVEMGADFLGCDAGSVDPGPYYLGTESTTKSKGSIRRDLHLLLTYAIRNGIPLIVGSAATSGKNWGVDWYASLIREIAAKENLSFKMALIYSEMDPKYVLDKLAQDKVEPLGSAPPLTPEDVRASNHIVGMMGVEPFVEALRMGAQVIVAGRSSDTSIYAAIPLMRGIPRGLAWHAAKVIECGAAVAIPKSPDGMAAFLAPDHFIIETPNPDKVVRKTNVAAHTMYENLHPTIVHEPGGYLDTGTAVYEQLDDKRVKVSGSTFVEKDRYDIKLEGSALVGYRSAFIAGIRDDGLIDCIDDYIAELRRSAAEKIRRVYGLEPDKYSIQTRVYGKNGVMAERETRRGEHYELGLLLDVVADTQETADELLTLTRGLALHQHFEGRLCNAGNLAFPYSPLGITLGPVYRFSVNHVVEIEDPLELFPIHIVDVNCSA